MSNKSILYINYITWFKTSWTYCKFRFIAEPELNGFHLYESVPFIKQRCYQIRQRQVNAIYNSNSN